MLIRALKFGVWQNADFIYFYQMDIHDFIDKFSACLSYTPVSSIGPDTHFKKLDEWSSIFALIVIGMVDSDYKKVLTAEDIRSATTLSDLFNLIQSK